MQAKRRHFSKLFFTGLLYLLLIGGNHERQLYSHPPTLSFDEDSLSNKPLLVNDLPPSDESTPRNAPLPTKITITQNELGPYPKTGVTLATFPLYNGCPDLITAENAADYRACVNRWLDVTAQLLTELEVDVFRVPFGANAANEIIGPDLLIPLEAPRPPFHGLYFTGQTMMIGWPETEALSQATNADIMWVLNVRDICILGICGTGTLERAQTVVQALAGKVDYYELGSEDYRPALLNQYIERVNRFGTMIQYEDPEATYAAVLRDDFIWDALGAHVWKEAIVNTPGPHHLQRHLYFPADADGIKFHQQEAQFIFSMPITQSGSHTLTLQFTGDNFSPATDVLITADAIPLHWHGNGFTADLPANNYEVTITSQTNARFTLDYLFDLTTPTTTQSSLSILEGRSGWELYLAGADGIGADLIPQNTGDRKIWVSEISELGNRPFSATDGQWGHRWLDALAYASGFMQAAADPRVEIILGHTLYELPWFGMVSGVGRAPWQPWTPGTDGISMIDPKPRPKFWVHQQMARHMKNGQQLLVQMPIDYYHLDGSIQMGYSGYEPQQIPLLECWATNGALNYALLCINRSYDQPFTYPVEVENSLATTAEMTTLVGHPADHNEGDIAMITPQSQSVSLDNVTFLPRSLTRLEIAKESFPTYLPIAFR